MLGPEIVEGDLVRPSTLEPALKGAEQLYLLAPRNPRLSAMEASLIGVSDWQVEQIVGSAEAFVAGEVAEVTDVVEHLTGHRPRSFATFARQLRAAA